MFLMKRFLDVIAAFDGLPVEDLPEGGEMGGTAVLVVEIVGVFPDVEGEQGFEALGDGVVRSGLLGDDQGAVFLCGEPHPAAAEEGDAFGLELGLEGIHTPPLLQDLGRQRRLRVKPAMRVRGTELREVEVVIQDLAGVVEDGAGGLLHNLFQREIFHAAAGKQFVEVINVALQMLSMVEFEGLRADYWVERVDFVRELY